LWLFGAVGTKNPVGLVATVFPEFIARDERERADGGRQGDKRRVGAARRRSRGHGPARLDGTRPRATVAEKVMESGKMAGQAAAALHADRTASEARRPEAGSRAGGVSRAERGHDGSPQVARCATRTTARPAISQVAGDARVPAARSSWTALAHAIGKIVPVMDIRELQDEALVAQAREWRLRALRGEKGARGLAHELECEVRRRFPLSVAPQALPRTPLLGALPPTAQRRWKPW